MLIGNIRFERDLALGVECSLSQGNGFLSSHVHYTTSSCSPIADCTCVAFQPLSRNLTCSHECSLTENVTVYWNLYRYVSANNDNSNYNITFWFDGSEPRHDSHTSASVTTIVRQMRATQGGQLVMDKVNLHIHEAGYSCWAQLSDGTQCGTTDSFQLSVVSLCELLRQRRTQSIGIQCNTRCWGLVCLLVALTPAGDVCCIYAFLSHPIISLKGSHTRHTCARQTSHH